MHRAWNVVPVIAALVAGTGQADSPLSAHSRDVESFDDADPAVHTFDHIYEDGFDCSPILSPGIDLVAWIAALTPGRHVICLKAGTYVLSGSLALPSDTVLEGLGQGANRSSTTLFLSPHVDADAIRIAGKQHVAIRHLKLDANGASQAGSPAPAGISITQSYDVTVDDVQISNAARMAIAASTDSNLRIANSRIDTMDRLGDPAAVGAIWLSSGSQLAVIEDNQIIGANNGPGGDGGIDCYGSDMVHIARNTLTNTGESSIYTGSPGCTNMSIFDNHILNSNEFGIDITLGASHIAVNDNRIDSTALAAMIFWQVDDVSIRNNWMQNGHAYPPSVPCRSIVLDTATSVTIDNTNHVDTGPLYCFR